MSLNELLALKRKPWCSLEVEDLYVDGILFYNGVTGPTQFGCTGPTGNIGPTGQTGNVGPTGPSSINGNTGCTGLIGNTGNTGITGLQGNTGNTGITGLQGNTGNTGITGLQGNTGNTGNTGITGITGIQGNTGNTGCTGLQGITGNTGITGIQGKTGNTGITGLQGITGNTGNTGPNGIIGNTLQLQTLGVSGGITTTSINGITGALSTSLTTPDVDNSASLTLGVTSATLINIGRSSITTTINSENLSFPNRPRCYVISSGTKNNITGDSTTYTVPFQTKVYDVGSGFGSTGYTVPVAGIYTVSATVYITNISSSHTVGVVQIVQNGGGSNTCTAICNPYACMSTSASDLSFNVSRHMNCAVNDIISVTLQVRGSSKTVDTGSFGWNVLSIAMID
jgi:hypothetical protein